MIRRCHAFFYPVCLLRYDARLALARGPCAYGVERRAHRPPPPKFTRIRPRCRGGNALRLHQKERQLPPERRHLLVQQPPRPRRPSSSRSRRTRGGSPSTTARRRSNTPWSTSTSTPPLQAHSKKLWAVASNVFAERTKGETHAYLGPVMRSQCVYTSHEKPTLMAKPHVSKITEHQLPHGRNTVVK